MNERERIVSEIMQTEVFSVKESDRLDCEQVMRLGWVQNIPVLGGTQLVGIVSSWDLVTAALSKERENQPEQCGAMKCAIDVKEIMTRNAVSIDPDATLGEAAELMALHRTDCLPIVAPDETLLGVVTKSDLIRATLL
jgi:acetoin utilization protein AcuB